jgi:phosphoribosyl 1,2-cyclic phosphodiesterase
VRHDNLPPLVLDSGTGARKLGIKLVQEPGRRLQMLFTHFHMDHVFGFPFFAPLYTPGFEIDVTIPASDDEEARERLSGYLNGVYHPVRLRDLPCTLRVHAARADRDLDRGGWKVRGITLNHPGGAVGWRVEAGGKSVCYITDSAPFATPGEGVVYDRPPTPGEQRMVRFLEGADVVVYDTMYELPEYLEKMTWGHSYPEYARGLCAVAGVRHLVLFHHAPDASDDELDARARAWAGAASPRVSLAREGERVFAEG